MVVKIIRPGAAEALRGDLIEARRLASSTLARRLLRGVDLGGVLDEFAGSLERELDLRVEGRVADRFAFDFRPDPKIVVPRIVWPLSAPRVLTMERMYGWRLSELSDAELAGVDAHGLGGPRRDGVHAAGDALRPLPRRPAPVESVRHPR